MSMVKIKHMFARFESARLQGKQQANVYIDVIIILIILYLQLNIYSAAIVLVLEAAKNEDLNR